MTGPHAPADSAGDSAGQPWAGRAFPATPPSQDDGSAPPAFLTAIRAFRAGEAGAAAVVDALRDCRLLVPLVAVAGEEGVTATGTRVDKTQELSIVTVRAPDGRAVMPAFSSVDAMRAWNPAARPIPQPAARVALAAAAEGTELIVIDPTSASEFALRRPAVRALAEGVAWRPPADDAALAERMARAISAEPAVRSIRLEAGDPDQRLRGAETIVRLGVAPGLTADELSALTERLGARWAADEGVVDRVDSMRLAIEPAVS